MKLRLLAVLPVLDAAWAQPCIESILMPDSSLGIEPDELLLVDNTRHGDLHYEIPDGVEVYRDSEGHNLGVARSWNIGARHVLEADLEYLLIVSASLLFGPMHHTTWVEQMVRFSGERVIECDGHSWHLIAFHRSVFEQVGLFDENFYPAYVEAIDFGYRMRMAGLEGGWTRCWVNVLTRAVAWHVRQDPALVLAPFAPLDAYYRSKWGGPKGEETHVRPFGDKPLDYWPEHSIPELAARYDLGERGGGWW